MFATNQKFTVDLTMQQLKAIEDAPIKIKMAQNERDIAQNEMFELIDALKFLASKCIFLDVIRSVHFEASEEDMSKIWVLLGKYKDL